MNKINAIIINYNTKTSTCNCIKLLKENLQAIKSSIIVIDNASSDGSQQEIATKYPDIALIRNTMNKGFAFACNQAANLSRNADFLLFANSDTKPETDTVKKMIAFMKNNPSTAITGAKLINSNGSNQHSFSSWPDLTNELIGNRLLQIIKPEKYPSKHQKIKTPLKVQSIIGAFFIIRNDIFKQVKGFDERFFFFMEETDLCRKIINSNLDIIFHPEIKVTHLQGESANKNPEWSRHNFYRSKYQFLNKWNGKKILTIIYLKNITTITVKISIYLFFNILSLFLYKKLKNKFQIAYWLLKNHFLGFPPYIKTQKIHMESIPEKHLKQLDNELKVSDDFIFSITQKNTITVMLKSEKTLKKFINNHAMILSIGIPVLRISSLITIKKTDTLQRIGIEMSSIDNIEFLHDFLNKNEESQVGTRDNIFNMLKDIILTLEEKQVFLQNIQLNDFIISYKKETPDILEIFLINMTKVHFGFFFINKTDLTSLNKLF